MGTRLNRRAFKIMVDEDIEWLRKAAKALGDTNEGPSSELGHVISILRESERYYYEDYRKKSEVG